MTIASDYQNAADFVVGFATRDEPIPARTAAALAQALLDLADRVRHLEDVPLRLDAPEVSLPFKRTDRKRTHAR